MNTRQIAEVLGKLDDQYVEEALAYRPAAQHRAWVRWGAAAACFAVVCTAVLAFESTRRCLDRSVSPSSSPEVTAEPSVSVPISVPPEPEALRISLGSVTVNKIDEPTSAARLYFDPALYDEEFWDRDTTAGYFGRDLAPAYVPAGLESIDGNGTTRAEIRKEDSEIVWDTVHYSYYQIFGTWEDGTPRYSDENTVRHGFVLSATKAEIGLFNCGIVYIGPEDERKTTDIAGTPVTIGFRAMPYGPYDPETHEPAGYYDLYVAEFELGSIKLQLVADELELEEVVKIAASVICPEREVILTP